MKIQRDHVVELHYEVRNDDGELLESSRERQPLAILQGHRNVIRGVETQLVGHSAGDRFQLTVRPEEGYGLRRDGWTERVPKKRLAGGKRVRVGDDLVARTSRGLRRVTVLKVGSSVVDVDLNHPMAGLTLHFDVEIVSVRAASHEELAHGHAHGPGGHEH